MTRFIYKVTLYCFAVLISLYSVTPTSAEEKFHTVADGPELPSFDSVRGLVWGNNQFVAVGLHSLILTTPDGRTWTTRYWDDRRPDSNELLDIAWGNHKYVAVGTNGWCLTSADGFIWESIFSITLQGWRLLRIHAINDHFYVIGSQRVANSQDKTLETTALFVSSDGENWERMQAPSDLLADIAGNNGELVLLSWIGKVYKSNDAKHWQASSVAPKFEHWGGGASNRIIWNGSIYLALRKFGSGSVFATSKDGLNWHYKEFDEIFYKLIWNGQVFVAAGHSSGMAVSSNGLDWTFIKLGLSSPQGLAGANGTSLLTAWSSDLVMLRSDDGVNWQGIHQKKDRLGNLEKERLPEVGRSKTYSLIDIEVESITEEESLKRDQDKIEELRYFIVKFLLGLALYIVLQMLAIYRMQGVWKFLAWLPVLPFGFVFLVAFWDYAKKSNLWPLTLPYFLPKIVQVAVPYLLFLLFAHLIFTRKSRKPDRDSLPLKDCKEPIRHKLGRRLW